jgi:hypothetical protein
MAPTSLRSTASSAAPASVSSRAHMLAAPCSKCRVCHQRHESIVCLWHAAILQDTAMQCSRFRLVCVWSHDADAICRAQTPWSSLPEAE